MLRTPPLRAHYFNSQFPIPHWSAATPRCFFLVLAGAFIYNVCMAVNRDKVQLLQQRMAQLGVLDRDLTERFVRGSGRGGQKINKTNNCVCLIHEPTGIVVRCHRERERETNRFLARRALCDELEFLQTGIRPAIKHETGGRSSLRNTTVTRRKHAECSAAEEEDLPLPDMSAFAEFYNLDESGNQLG